MTNKDKLLLELADMSTGELEKSLADLKDKVWKRCCDECMGGADDCPNGEGDCTASLADWLAEKYQGAKSIL